MQRTPPELKTLARALRNGSTPAERRLWRVLRDHRPRFTRQLVVSHFILDFACRSRRLGIELDGGHHALQLQQDANRTAYLEAQGWQILRFWNNDVLANTEGVARTIFEAVARAPTHPRPSLPGRGAASVVSRIDGPDAA